MISIAAYVFAVLGDGANAQRYARRAISINVRYAWDAIEALRNADLMRMAYGEALARDKSAYPELFGPSPAVQSSNVSEAIGVDLALQRIGELKRAADLVVRAERVSRSLQQNSSPRLGFLGAQIHALRGDFGAALNARAIDAVSSPGTAKFRGRRTFSFIPVTCSKPWIPLSQISTSQGPPPSCWLLQNADGTF